MGWTLVILGILAVVAIGGIVVFGGGDAEESGGGDVECPDDCPVEPVSLEAHPRSGVPEVEALPAPMIPRAGVTVA